MKNLFIILFLILMLIPVSVFGAGATTTLSSDTKYGNMRILVVAFDADDTSGVINAYTLDSGVTGWSLYKVSIDGNSGTTEVTEDSDMYVYQIISGVTVFDQLDGNGVDQVDNSAAREVYPAVDGQAYMAPIVYPLSFEIINNSVADARGTFYIILKRD